MQTGSSIFITGADGFIGSHLTESLVNQGFKVKALAQYNSFNNYGWLDNLPAEIIKDTEIVMGDVRDTHQMRHEIRNMEYVMHLAALVAIPYSYVAPQSYIDTNISGTLNVLQAARDFDIPIIHTSTSEVYGSAQYVPMDEQHPLQGQSPYSASKIAADQIAYSFFSSFGLPVKIIRPFNTYGPRQSMRAVIPTIIVQIANGVREIELGAISPSRDFSYVSDTVSGFIKAMNSEKGIGEVVNLGSNFEVFIKDAVNIIADAMNADVKVISKSDRLRPVNSEVQRLFSSNNKAKELFNWTPEYAGHEGFKKGIIKTARWFSNKENLKHFRSNKYVI
ncbi:NAD-dependent 4,6-dehydratase LegB [Alphaproteobacteria bacterium]|nr:NAD-dependent 4,6-dehydratase LegB [Alphaproteobacteria bacterium]